MKHKCIFLELYSTICLTDVVWGGKLQTSSPSDDVMSGDWWIGSSAVDCILFEKMSKIKVKGSLEFTQMRNPETETEVHVFYLQARQKFE